MSDHQCPTCGQTLSPQDRIAATIRDLRGQGRLPQHSTMMLGTGLARSALQDNVARMEAAGRLVFDRDEGGRRIWATVKVVES